MPTRQRILVAGAFSAAACLAVFWLPFRLAPAPLQGLSAANLAGFNNKVAAVAAAVCSLCALLLFYRAALPARQPLSHARALSPATVLCVALLYCSCTALLGVVVLASDALYPSDLDYFVHQLTSHVVYGKSLYSQVEFGYGPLLFYFPLFLRPLLTGLHFSLRTEFVITVVLVQFAGMCLLTYVINALPMTYRWRLVAFTTLGLHSFQLNLSLNYQWVRFLVPASCIVLASRCRRSWMLAAVLLLGQAACLAISPEMGAAFLAAGTFFAVHRFFHSRSSVFLWLATLPLVSTALFLSAMMLLGGGYLRTLRLFSSGVLALVVQPLPYVLVFLLALLGLVPWLLANEARQRTPDLPLLLALYVSALALLPVAFGRADPTHVLMNGVVIYLLSFVAAGQASAPARSAWLLASGSAILFTFFLNSRVYAEQVSATIPGLRQHRFLQETAYDLARVFRPRMPREVFQRAAPATLDIPKLESFVRKGRVTNLIPTSRLVDEELVKADLYAPSFYFGFDNQLDRRAEMKEVAEFNEAKWALLPAELDLSIVERPDRPLPLGPQFFYPVRHTPYIVGRLFLENLQANWEQVSTIPQGYVLYRRR